MQNKTKIAIVCVAAILIGIVAFIILKPSSKVSSQFTSIMESKGFTVSDQTDSKNDVIKYQYQAKKSSTNITCNFLETDSSDSEYASTIYAEVKMDIMNKLMSDGDGYPSSNEDNNKTKFTMKSKNYYAIVTYKDNKVCSLIAPASNVSEADGIISELGF